MAILYGTNAPDQTNPLASGGVGTPTLGINPDGSGGPANSTAAADTITGSGGNDDLDGQGGPDSISGGFGDDSLAGGAGNDTLEGEQGNDTLYDNGAAAENDSYDGGDGTDTVDYTAAAVGVTADLTAGTATGAGTDTLTGIENISTGTGADSVTGTDEANIINTGGGADTIVGGDGDDSLTGGGGNDSVQGGDGDDILYDPGVAGQNDTYDGGAGIDTLRYFGAVATNANLATGVVTGPGNDTISGIENINTGNAADNVIGTEGNNIIDTNAGADTLDGGGGADTLKGGVGDDQYIVGLTGQGTRIFDEGGNDTLTLPAGFTITLDNVLRKGNSLIIDLNGDGRFLPNTATPPEPLPPWGAPVTDQDLVIENFFGDPGTGSQGVGYIETLGNLTADETGNLQLLLNLPTGAGPNINSDSTPDIAFRNPTTGVNGVWYMSYSAPPGGGGAETRRFAFDVIVPQADPNQRLVGMGNYSENFAGSELFWYDQATGRTGLWYNVASDGSPTDGYPNDIETPTSAPESFRANNLLLIDEAGWEFGASANLDNGTNDGAVWYNTNTGAIAYWNLETDPVTGLTYVDEATNYGNDPSLVGWSLRTAGDFDNDGFRDDLVWQNNTTNAIAIWYMDATAGLTRTSMLDPTAANWKVAGAGDYNQSPASGALPSSLGTTDLLLTNVVTGENAVWSLSAATATTGPGFIGGYYIEPAPGYEAVAA